MHEMNKTQLWLVFLRADKGQIWASIVGFMICATILKDIVLSSFPNSMPILSHWQLEIGDDGNIYALKISNNHQSTFFSSKILSVGPVSSSVRFQYVCASELELLICSINYRHKLGNSQKVKMRTMYIDDSKQEDRNVSRLGKKNGD